MKKLVFYDTSGNVMQECLSLDGAGRIEVEIPTGKFVKEIDTETKEAILEDIPKTEYLALQEQIDNLTIALAEVMGV